MSLINTINFLPQVFRSSTNQRFLGATFDQLYTADVDVPINGYVGRTFAPTFKLKDNYVPEIFPSRANYQLEPSIVAKDSDGKVVFNSTYTDLISGITNNNGVSNNHQRMFAEEAYTFDGQFDYNKFVSYYNYYWLPNGPAAVSVFANDVPTQATYAVTKNTDIGGYTFSGIGSHPNQQITLARGGTYKFQINQPGAQFWIQSQPGVTGTDPNISTLTTRQVFGVTNNGIDSGEVIFRVPLSTAQDFYIQMPIAATVNAAVEIHYNQIHNRLLTEFLAEFPDGFDGLDTALNDKTLVFINNDQDDSFWTVDSVVVPTAQRPSVWKIKLSTVETDPDCVIQLIPYTQIIAKQKVFIGTGKTYASNQFWLDDNLRYKVVPTITANKDYLYYQDGSSSGFTGQIKLVDNETSTIDIANDIIGQVGYTSPNGVTFTNGLKVLFDANVVPAAYANTEFYVDGVGTYITLTPVSELVIVEPYGANIDTTPDYLTINRGSADRNAWSRSNRWFHIDVIDATAKYNNTTADYGPNIPARRPIIEFDAGLQLFNHGVQAKAHINYITFDATDAFNDVEGQTTAMVDGVTLVTGDRVVFANDYDTNILNKVYEVKIETINSVHYINLIETADDPILPGQMVLATGGTVNKSKSFTFNGTSWTECQYKSSVNQAPLFDAFDINGYSFSDSTVYPSSTFAGTKFFGYTVGTGTDDPVLGFPLQYQNFNNVGDISFSNYYDTESFDYTAGQDSVTVLVNSGLLTKNNGLTSSVRVNNWVKAVEDTKQYQLFTKFFDGLVITVDGVEKGFIQIDVLPAAQTTVPYAKVYLNNKILTPTVDYTIGKFGIYDVVTFTTMPTVGDKIDVAIFSNEVSATGYYEIPSNLEFNPLNESFSSITLGQIRNHYNKTLENTSILSSGTIPVQDLYTRAQGGTLLQHSSSLVYAMAFLNDADINFVNGLTLAKKEYTKFKNKFLSLCSSLTGLDYNDPVSGVDTILQNINAVKNSSFPWYYSDMVPQGGNYTSITYTVLNARQTNYEISAQFDITQLSNRAILIWINGVQQIHGIDYTFSANSPAVLFNKTFTVGDTILIRDYFDTDGNFIPETPTKLGLYPKFKPEIFADDTYQTTINAIRGHDGSITPAFNDFRDQYILELEKRIYNNIKADYTKNKIDFYNIVPGRFRTTEYTDAEFNQVLSKEFLAWAGANNLDYLNNTVFNINDSWTWNYSQFPDVIDGSMLQGSWRAIFEHWYDTDTPNLTPWVMLGFSDKPSWWDTRYGTGPYTSGNAVLWEDLENGYIWNNGAAYNDSRFARPGLTNIIPVDTAGNLLPPDTIPLISKYNTAQAGAPFAVGQMGPAEVAWRRSSNYPFAVQMALALLKPAEYFGTQLDVSKFYTNPYTGQFSTIDNKKVAPTNVDINGYVITYLDVTQNFITLPPQRTAGYINWIADGIKNLGIDPGPRISEFLTNLSVQLSYKVGGFTDKKMITVYAEQTTPGSTNASVIVPDANYSVYLNKSIPVSTVSYSAVIVEKTVNGYSITGYDINNPFFVIYPSIVNNKSETVVINEVSAKIYQTASTEPFVVPYGTEFTTIQQVTDFLISYERSLVKQGFDFTKFDSDLQEERNWTLSVKELLYWSQQGWAPGTIIVLNPAAGQLRLNTTGVIIDEVTNIYNGSKIIDQNFLPIKSNNFNIVRTESPFGNTFSIGTLTQTSICFAYFNLVQYEHVLVFDNISEFGDIFYIPSLGTRQYRLKLAGSKTGAWTGALSAPGYIYNDSNIPTWLAGTDYKTGDIVVNNNLYYTAIKDIVAATTFNPTAWAQINKSDIKTGLLPNFGHNAQSFNRIYDIDKPPADETLQSYSAGLIGFRQRPYLSDLGISIPTQTKFYQGYIKEKGSLNSINALTKANFNNISGDISVNEEWAFRVGVYGGVNTTSFTEFVLDQSLFTTNPVSFAVTDTYSSGNIIAGFTTANIYNASNVSSLSTTLYNNRVDDVYMTDLPSVGYVNVDDADYTIFDINNPTVDLTKLGAGDKVWVAKDAMGAWDILRVTETNLVATQITYTLDSYAQLKFSNAHTFAENDSMVLKYFDPEFDGIYKVVNVPNSLTITIQIRNASALKRLVRGMFLEGTGIAYAMVSARADTLDFVVDNVPSHGWIENDRVWINDATDAGWGVYTYNRPWTSNAVTKLTANTVVGNDRFGSALRISSNGNYVYVGNPGSKQLQVLANVGGQFVSNVTLSNVNVGFGSTIDSQGNLLVVGSQTDANVHVYRHWANAAITKIQTIKSANIAGVTSMSMSADQHWLYVGDITNNVVETYYTPNAGWANASYAWANKITGTAASHFGNVVKTNSTGTTLFVSAPNATNQVANNGNVYVYTRTANAFSLTQTLSSQHKNDSSLFGYGLDIDTAGNVYIGAPGSSESGYPTGAVEHYTLSSGSYAYVQTLSQPQDNTGRFGVSISVSGDAEVLAVGSQGSSADEHTYFDAAVTTIDADTTKFVDHILNSGVTYIFENINDKYGYSQELETQLLSGDMFGAAVDVTRGIIAVGAPGTSSNAGAVYVFGNPDQSVSWNLTRQQQPKVDVDSISRTFIYNKTNNNILAALDYLDPAKGKVLNAVDKDIDFKTVSDPASYNAGTGVVNPDHHWGIGQVGKIWWNLDSVRYIDYEQDALIYRLNHWGERFPGSTVQVLEWTESNTLPSQYTGSGTPLHADDSAYSTRGYVDQAGNVKIKYYFWVANSDTVNTRAGKSNSAFSIASSIENPQSQGIPYATVLKDNAIALYNVTNKLTGKNSVLHLGTQSIDSNLIHSEYALVQEGNTNAALPKTIVDKLTDSLAGIDRVGNPVPDPALPVSQRYGISIRPRQSMVLDRDVALFNIVDLVNTYLAAYPVVSRKPLTLLNSEEPIPSADSGDYDLVVNTIDELGYVNTSVLSAGYNVLVLNDATQMTMWSIYEFNGTAFETTPHRVQSYKTSLYWSYINWYDSSFDPTSTIDVTVNTNLDLGKLILTADTFVKVLDDGHGKFVIYYVDSNLALNIVGLESGTIQIGTNMTPPPRETRQLLLAVQQEILTDDIASEYNNIFFVMMRYILGEQKNIDWLFKTSFVSAKQRIRKLEQFPSYIADNQDFYLDYINEVKPYRTVVREFIVDYERNDEFGGDITDFDLPPYWDRNMNVYRSPSGEQPYDNALLNAGVYSQWTANHLYKVVDVIIEAGGAGYLFAPQITFAGGGGTGATGYAEIDSGQVIGIVITNPGQGYTSIPDIIINGTGSGAKARAVLRNVFDNNNSGHNLVRSIKTNIKFDRISYTTSNTFQIWDTVTSGQVIAGNTIILFNEALYKLTSNTYTVTESLEFPLGNVTQINAGDFNTANDRITAFNGNVDLSLLVDGISYPGVGVDGNTATLWTANLSVFPGRLITNAGNLYITTGNVFDAGGTFANISSNVTAVSADTYTDVGVNTDSIISSHYTDSLGVNPSDIIIDGGAFVDEYSSHAPQELVPGQMFDSLNLQVFSNTSPTANDYAFRIFKNMTNEFSYYRISAANTTDLSANLSVTDSNVYVTDSSVLPIPNPTLAIPGVVFIGGEKITYYTNDTVNNVLGQIRRGVDGTGTPLLHAANTRVSDTSVQQIIPGSAPTFANIGGNVVMQDTSWYNTGSNTATNGTGLINSTTDQALFLLAKPGYMPG
jgi:hypothetical protein